MDEIFKQQAQLLLDQPNISVAIKRNPDFKTIFDDVTVETSYMEANVPIRQRIWHVLNGVHSPKCKSCDIKNTKWNKLRQCYAQYCSIKCANQDPEVLARRAATVLKEYGQTIPLKNDKIQAKRKATMIDKYGVEYSGQSSAIRSKMAATNIERYGVDHVFNSPEKRQDAKNTMLKKYGVDNPAKSADFRLKIESTNLERYGTKHIFRADAPVQRRLSIPYNASLVPDGVYDMLVDSAWLTDQHITQQKTLQTISNELGVSISFISKKAQALGIEIQHYTSGSNEEFTLVEFVKSLDVPYQTNKRKIIPPYELDIYLPTLNKAIEFNGNRWHSELAGKNRTYHINKYNMCKEANIQLLQFWGHEWTYKRDIVQSIIAANMGKCCTVYGRLNTIHVLAKAEEREFFDTNHLQGYHASTICIGLKSKDGEITAAMSFCKSRFNTTYEWEILRFANKLNTRVIGGASKLLAHFKQTSLPTSILSYCDKRYGTGSVYKACGFSFIGNTPPNYNYVRTNNYGVIFSRHQFQKHKLKDKLEIFDPTLSEWENMKANGYDRIWDCGNGVFGWKVD